MVLDHPITLIILSIFGIFIAGYITFSHKTKSKDMVCPIGDSKSCKIVTESKYSKTLGLRNDIGGILYYTIVIIETILIIKGFNIKIPTILISGIAFLFSIWLTHIQANILKKWCFWCVLSTIVNFLILLSFWLI